MEEAYFIPAPTLKEKEKRPTPITRKMSGFTRMGSYKMSNRKCPDFEVDTTDTKSTEMSSIGSETSEEKMPFLKRINESVGGKKKRADELKNVDDGGGGGRRRGVVIDPFHQNNIRSKLKSRLRRIVDERLTVKQIFSRYVESSTLHGFLYTCSDTYLIRRFIWALLMILGAIYFLIKLREGIIEYFEYPISTLSTVDYPDELAFPAISFCLVNNYKLKELSDSKLGPLLRQGRFPLQTNWTDPGYDIPGKELVNELNRTSLSAKEIFEGCDWINRDTAHPLIEANKCDVSNFTDYFNEKNEKCFTLNSGKEGHPLLHVTHGGLSYGYDALFDMKSSETFRSHDYIGLKVYIHSQHEPPTADSGFILAPGFRYFINMKMHEVFISYIL